MEKFLKKYTGTLLLVCIVCGIILGILAFYLAIFTNINLMDSLYCMFMGTCFIWLSKIGIEIFYYGIIIG